MEVLDSELLQQLKIYKDVLDMTSFNLEASKEAFAESLLLEQKKYPLTEREALFASEIQKQYEHLADLIAFLTRLFWQIGLENH